MTTHVIRLSTSFDKVLHIVWRVFGQIHTSFGRGEKLKDIYVRLFTMLEIRVHVPQIYSDTNRRLPAFNV